MAWRNRSRNAVPADKWKKAFTQSETSAVHRSLGQLYLRALTHTVAPQFNIPSLVSTYHNMIADSVWQLFGEVSAIRHTVKDENTYSSGELYEPKILVDGYPHGVEMLLKTRLLIPSLPKLKPHELDQPMPPAIGQYAAAAFDCRAQWKNVIAVFDNLNKITKRATAAYYWPCVVSLIKLSDSSFDADNLTDVQRPGVVPSEIVPNLRETNSFVMQHMLLPAVDKPQMNAYEGGDYNEGVTARLQFVQPSEHFQNVIWPLVQAGQ